MNVDPEMKTLFAEQNGLPMDFAFPEKLNEWQMVANNPLSGVSTWMLDDGDDLHVETRQDVDALLDENKALKSVASHDWKGDGLHSVARVPLALVHDTNSLLGGAIAAGDDKIISKVLNDAEFRDLRTKEGKI